MLEFRDLSATLGGRALVRGLDHLVPQGQVHAVVGPSGAGKTTLLRAICGLVPATGEVLVGGRAVQHLPAHRRGIGMMFQDDQLFPTMNVGRNVGYGLRVAGVPRTGVAGRVGELLEMVGLAGFEDRDVGTLSGGERRRVALARSLAPRPGVLLLDEPMTGLEPDLRRQLLADVVRLLRETDTTALLVTHDPGEARVADAVIRMPSVSGDVE